MTTKATLPANYIAECEMFILPDVLHPCAFADSTIKYTGIYGKIINYEWMRSIARRRVDALKLLQMVLDNTETGLSYEVSQALIVQLASTLDETDVKLLTLRYGLDKGLPMSAAEDGKILGMSADEVTTREATALAQLRNEQ